MKRRQRIAILAENMYQEMELWVPYYRLREEGVQADQVKAVEFDAVIVPGGGGPRPSSRSRTISSPRARTGWMRRSWWTAR